MAIAFALMALVWAGGVVGAPYVSRVSAAAATTLYAVGSIVCHQRPERSFHVAGARLPVCARCTGIYAGAALGASAWLLLTRRRTRLSRTRALAWLAVAAVPTALTVGTAMIGVLDPPNIWRAACGVPLGVAVGLVVDAAAGGQLR